MQKCLDFDETDVLDLLDRSYSETSPICELVANVSLDVLEYYLKVVLNAFTVNS